VPVTAGRAAGWRETAADSTSHGGGGGGREASEITLTTVDKNK